MIYNPPPWIIIPGGSPKIGQILLTHPHPEKCHSYLKSTKWTQYKVVSSLSKSCMSQSYWLASLSWPYFFSVLSYTHDRGGARAHLIGFYCLSKNPFNIINSTLVVEWPDLSILSCIQYLRISQFRHLNCSSSFHPLNLMLRFITCYF